MARPKKDKYIIDNLCKVIDNYTQEHIDNNKYPVLKECCIFNNLCYDYVIELQKKSKEEGDERLSRSIRRLLDWKEVLLERGGLSGSVNSNFAMFILKQPAHNWRDKPKEEEDNSQVVEALKLLGSVKEAVKKELENGE